MGAYAKTSAPTLSAMFEVLGVAQKPVARLLVALQGVTKDGSRLKDVEASWLRSWLEDNGLADVSPHKVQTVQYSLKEAAEVLGHKQTAVRAFNALMEGGVITPIHQGQRGHSSLYAMLPIQYDAHVGMGSQDTNGDVTQTNTAQAVENHRESPLDRVTSEGKGVTFETERGHIHGLKGSHGEALNRHVAAHPLSNPCTLSNPNPENPPNPPWEGGEALTYKERDWLASVGVNWNGCCFTIQCPHCGIDHGVIVSDGFVRGKCQIKGEPIEFEIGKPVEIQEVDEGYIAKCPHCKIDRFVTKDGYTWYGECYKCGQEFRIGPDGYYC